MWNPELCILKLIKLILYEVSHLSTVRNGGRTQSFTPVISAFWEDKVGGSQGQESETVLANMVKPHFYSQYNN